MFGLVPHGAVQSTASGASVDVGQDAVGHTLAVPVPGHAVFLPALALVPSFSVDKQQGEVNHVEIRQNVVKACGEEQETV